MSISIGDIKRAVVLAIEDIKGFDIETLDVRSLTSMTSYMIIASASSTRQTKSIARHICEKLKVLGATVLGVEGAKEGEWVLIDLGELVVHILLPATRNYYNLEQLWNKTLPANTKFSWQDSKS